MQKSVAFANAFFLLLSLSAVADDKLPPVKIALIGDSTVASYRPSEKEIAGWGQMLHESFSDRVTVKNHAASGRSSRSFLREGRWEPVLKEKPDYVFIQFGHNDQPGKGDRTTDPDGDFRDNLRKYVADARAIGAKPILVTPVARRTFRDGKITSSQMPYVKAVLAVGEEQKVPVIDLNAASTELFERLGDEGSADLSCDPNDRTHFSFKGGREIAKLVVDRLPAAVPELVPYRRQDSGR